MKKLLGIFIILLIALSLIACDKDKGSDEDYVEDIFTQIFANVSSVLPSSTLNSFVLPTTTTATTHPVTKLWISNTPAVIRVSSSNNGSEAIVTPPSTDFNVALTLQVILEVADTEHVRSNTFTVTVLSQQARVDEQFIIAAAAVVESFSGSFEDVVAAIMLHSDTLGLNAFYQLENPQRIEFVNRARATIASTSGPLITDIIAGTAPIEATRGFIDSIRAIINDIFASIGQVLIHNLDFTTATGSNDYVLTPTAVEVSDRATGQKVEVIRQFANIGSRSPATGITTSIRYDRAHDAPFIQTAFAVSELSRIELTFSIWGAATGTGDLGRINYLQAIEVQVSADGESGWRTVNDFWAEFVDAARSDELVTIELLIPTEHDVYVRILQTRRPGVGSTTSSNAFRIIWTNMSIFGNVDPYAEMRAAASKFLDLFMGSNDDSIAAILTLGDKLGIDYDDFSSLTVSNQEALVGKLRDILTSEFVDEKARILSQSSYVNDILLKVDFINFAIDLYQTLDLATSKTLALHGPVIDPFTLCDEITQGQIDDVQTIIDSLDNLTFANKLQEAFLADFTLKIISIQSNLDNIQTLYDALDPIFFTNRAANHLLTAFNSGVVEEILAAIATYGDLIYTQDEINEILGYDNEMMIAIAARLQEVFGIFAADYILIEQRNATTSLIDDFADFARLVIRLEHSLVSVEKMVDGWYVGDVFVFTMLVRNQFAQIMAHYYADAQIIFTDEIIGPLYRARLDVVFALIVQAEQKFPEMAEFEMYSFDFTNLDPMVTDWAISERTHDVLDVLSDEEFGFSIIQGRTHGSDDDANKGFVMSINHIRLNPRLSTNFIFDEVGAVILTFRIWSTDIALLDWVDSIVLEARTDGGEWEEVVDFTNLFKAIASTRKTTIIIEFDKLENVALRINQTGSVPEGATEQFRTIWTQMAVLQYSNPYIAFEEAAAELFTSWLNDELTLDDWVKALVSNAEILGINLPLDQALLVEGVKDARLALIESHLEQITQIANLELRMLQILQYLDFINAVFDLQRANIAADNILTAVRSLVLEDLISAFETHGETLFASNTIADLFFGLVESQQQTIQIWLNDVFDLVSTTHIEEQNANEEQIALFVQLFEETIMLGSDIFTWRLMINSWFDYDIKLVFSPTLEAQINSLTPFDVDYILKDFLDVVGAYFTDELNEIGEYVSKANDQLPGVLEGKPIILAHDFSFNLESATNNLVDSVSNQMFTFTFVHTQMAIVAPLPRAVQLRLHSFRLNPYIEINQKIAEVGRIDLSFYIWSAADLGRLRELGVASILASYTGEDGSWFEVIDFTEQFKAAATNERVTTIPIFFEKTLNDVYLRISVEASDLVTGNQLRIMVTEMQIYRMTDPLIIANDAANNILEALRSSSDEEPLAAIKANGASLRLLSLDVLQHASINIQSSVIATLVEYFTNNLDKFADIELIAAGWDVINAFVNAIDSIILVNGLLVPLANEVAAWFDDGVLKDGITSIDILAALNELTIIEELFALVGTDSSHYGNMLIEVRDFIDQATIVSINFEGLAAGTTFANTLLAFEVINQVNNLALSLSRFQGRIASNTVSGDVNAFSALPAGHGITRALVLRSGTATTNTTKDQTILQFGFSVSGLATLVFDLAIWNTMAHINEVETNFGQLVLQTSADGTFDDAVDFAFGSLIYVASSVAENRMQTINIPLFAGDRDVYVRLFNKSDLSSTSASLVFYAIRVLPAPTTQMYVLSSQDVPPFISNEAVEAGILASAVSPTITFALQNLWINSTATNLQTWWSGATSAINAILPNPLTVANLGFVPANYATEHEFFTALENIIHTRLFELGYNQVASRWRPNNMFISIYDNNIDIFGLSLILGTDLFRTTFTVVEDEFIIQWPTTLVTIYSVIQVGNEITIDLGANGKLVFVLV